MQYIISLGLLVAAWFYIPWAVGRMKRSQRGRLGNIVTSFGSGLAAALDPSRAAILQENEREADRHGEKEDDEPVDDEDAALPKA